MSKRLLAISFTAIYFATSAAFAQNILYQHDFSGAGSLDGVTPDIDNINPGEVWDAAALFGNDGTVAPGAGNNTPEGGAYLPFSPEDGQTYTLEASVLHDSEGWIGFGFARSNNGGNLSVPQARHAQTGVDGYAWMLTRNSASSNDQEIFTGPTTSNAYLGGDLVDPTAVVDMKIVLDTTGGAGNWTAEYFFNDVSQGLPDTIVFDAGDSINYVGFSRDVLTGTAGATTAGGTIFGFSLSTTATVFEPADANEDGMVDENDYFIIRDNLFETEIGGNPVGKGDGDIVADGIVDLADFRFWKDAASPAALIAAGLLVPEPSSLLLVSVLALLGVGRSNRG